MATKLNLEEKRKPLIVETRRNMTKIFTNIHKSSYNRLSTYPHVQLTNLCNYPTTSISHKLSSKIQNHYKDYTRKEEVGIAYMCLNFDLSLRGHRETGASHE